MKEYIDKRVHELYWTYDVNCARACLICLGELFDTKIERQTMASALGMHGAGGYRAQCGLVEGSIMFIGIYLYKTGQAENKIVSACRGFAEKFEDVFGSLLCRDLRPNGFSRNDPPHLCESLTCRGIAFAYQHIQGITPMQK